MKLEIVQKIDVANYEGIRGIQIRFATVNSNEYKLFIPKYEFEELIEVMEKVLAMGPDHLDKITGRD